MEIHKVRASNEERQLLTAFMLEQCPTDIDFNWLMPVVEKITNIWATTTNRKRLKECTPIFRALQNRLGLIEISGVYELSVDFIRWYNNQPKP